MLLSVFVLAAWLPLAQEPVAPQAPPPDAPEATAAPEAEPAKSESAPETASAASAPAAIEAGLRAFGRRRYQQAEIEFRRALEADPQSAAAAYYLGYTYYKTAEPKRPFHADKQKAAALFAKAYELDPTFRPAWTKR